MMKRIAIVTRKMVMGGIEKSLISLVDKLIEENCSVDLYVEEYGGELYDDISSKVTVYPIFPNNNSTVALLKSSNNIPAFFGNLCRLTCNRIIKKSINIWKNVCRCLPIREKEYDIAIAYSAPYSFSTMYAKTNIKARKKYAWIHNEVDKIEESSDSFVGLFDEYDTIFCVAKKTKAIFDNYFPMYKHKTEVFYNYIDEETILWKGKEPISNLSHQIDGYTTLLTVGRVCEQKGQDIIPDILVSLRQNGKNIMWLCVGDGEYRERVEKKAIELNVSDNLILCGTLKNPYPYYEICDIYIQPSRHEGFGITITEAKLFKKPIILTDFAGADEQVDSEVDGIIVEFDSDKIAAAIERLIDDSELKNRIATSGYQSRYKCRSNIRRIIGDD